ncbi:MAG TPA: inorganic pyrophosphatase [Pyrinomonadaceae bacterium]|jgi:inorganic pyrophosphatase|nr:inorganic pyrophosphatase [Pyrinomonadaceae bacterium]
MTEEEKGLGRLLGLMFQAHPWHGIPPGVDAPGVVNAYIEIVPTDAVKYELDKASGHLRVDRPQRFSSFPPTLYGFVPQTFCGDRVAQLCRRAGVEGAAAIRGDGDPMDICVLTERPAAHANFLVRARPVGGLRMIDGDEADDKIIAVMENDVTYGHIEDITQAPRGLIDRLQHYFLTYKQLPQDSPRRVEIADVYDREAALETIGRSIEDYRALYGAPESRVDELRRMLREGS